MPYPRLCFAAILKLRGCGIFLSMNQVVLELVAAGVLREIGIINGEKVFSLAEAHVAHTCSAVSCNTGIQGTRVPVNLILEPLTETRKEKIKQKEKNKTWTFTKPAPSIPSSLNTTQFVEMWNKYISYRRERKLNKLASSTIESMFKNFETWGVELAIEAVSLTIQNGWIGVFAPKGFKDQSINPLENNHPGQL